MSCLTVQKLISAYIDQRLAEQEKNSVKLHLARCRECAARSEQYSHVRIALRELAPAKPPARLVSRLQVLASHERARRMARKGFGGTLRHWVREVQFFCDDLMRPMALPFAGGLVSALCLFSMVVPTLSQRMSISDDVPTAFYTQPSLEGLPPSVSLSDDIVIAVSVDERGRPIDYSIDSGTLGHGEQPQVSNLVLFSNFRPATLFGRPISGKALVSFRKSKIVVRG